MHRETIRWQEQIRAIGRTRHFLTVEDWPSDWSDSQNDVTFDPFFAYPHLFLVRPSTMQ